MFWRIHKRKDSHQAEGAGGYLGHYGLTDWWQTTFTPEEQGYIQSRYAPFGSSEKTTLTTGNVGTIYRGAGQESSATHFLTGLSSWFTRKVDSSIGIRILEKALQGPFSDASDEHFALSGYIDVRYKQRAEDPSAVDDVVAACERMIEIAPQVAEEMKREYGSVAPGHRGFQQLRVLLKKRKDFRGVEELDRVHLERWWRHTEEYKRERAEAKSELSSGS